MGPKITAIIQARMTSTRLPGKVLMEVMGRPLLSYQIERLRFSKAIDEVVIATTTNKEDERIVALADSEGLKHYCGSEHDVLERYYCAAIACQAENIMRLTADCPLIDPSLLDGMIEVFVAEKADYIFPSSRFAEGTDSEMFTFSALSKAHYNAKLRSEREHVSRYFHNNPELFRIVKLENKTDDSKYRFTVDEKEDFAVVKMIIESLYDVSKSVFGIDKIKQFLDKHPDIININSHIVRNEGLLKSLQDDTRI